MRSHGNIPRLHEASYCLRVSGLVKMPLDVSAPELRDRFPSRSVTAVMQCTGNRHADLQQVGLTSGDPWAPGAIGNAEWTGAALADVLRAASAKAGATPHVAFDACDEVEMPEEGRFNYGASIPMAFSREAAAVTDHLLTGLVKRRAKLAGKIRAMHNHLRKMVGDPETWAVHSHFKVEAVRPKPFRPVKDWANRSRITRIVLSILRMAMEPVTSRDLPGSCW